MNKLLNYVLLGLAGFVYVAAMPAAHAHKPSDSYLQLRLDEQKLRGQWSISLRDLEAVLGLDSNNDRVITWGEVTAQKLEILQLAQEHLVFQPPSQSLRLAFTGPLIERLSDGMYAVLNFESSGPVQENTGLLYTLFFDIDAQHRGIATLSHAAAAPQIFVFTPDNREWSLNPHHTVASARLGTLLREGVWHIWKGFDHLLFLFALLLPAVLRFQDGRWEVAPRFNPIIVQVAKVVTAFTVAHSITLALAALHVVSLPTILVESVIAGSVVFAALNNFYPMMSRHTWVVAFLFGLVHGFGFANVFADLGLTGKDILVPLLAFNAGVELGQLAIVLLFLPIAFFLRGSPVYRVLILQYGSAAIALVATTWLIERIFDLKVLPF